MQQMNNDREAITSNIDQLSSGQRSLLWTIVETFRQPIRSNRKIDSDVIDAEILAAFGDILKLHHSLSDDYLDKQRFETALLRVFRVAGHSVSRPGRCNPGHDMTIDEAKWSLKTQGDSKIKRDVLHISKFMELGKGRWKSETDLPGLRDRFLDHLSGYDRIAQLRHFAASSEDSVTVTHSYEFVEIPKSLLLMAKHGQFEMRHNSQQTPKPGYCTVIDANGRTLFQLYFDGGSERKLQIKKLEKSECIVHASWEFELPLPV
jgi:hypothetical protein